LSEVIRAGLEQTEELWPEVRTGFDLLKRMAGVLRNEELLVGEQVRQRFNEVVLEMTRAAGQARASGQEKLAAALEHFAKVSASYEPGLFHCYDVADLEPTNNELEQSFGRVRHHERRASGRKKGGLSLVVRSVRLVAALATRLEEISVEALAPADLRQWQQKREELSRRRRARARQMRFRRNPDAFLRDLEDKLAQSRLPS
jgi:hypothetical protein